VHVTLNSSQWQRRRGTRCHAGPDLPAQSPAFGSNPPIHNSVEHDITEGRAQRSVRYAYVSVGAGSLLLFNEGLKRALLAHGVTFPPTLTGMLLMIVVLTTAKAASAQSAALVDAVVNFYAPLRDWVARWMPVFFVPSLIVLPKACAGIAVSEMVKVAQVTVAGWLGSLLLAAGLLRALRGAAHSDITKEEVRCYFITI
jgi:putative effector of murein hydrolase LrgA (UPF0299 family)